MRKLFRALTAATIMVAAGGTLIVGVSTASYADSTTPPPWDTFSPTDGATYGSNANPAAYGAVGGLTFYNSLGQQITGGSTASPFAAFVEGSDATGGTKAQLYFAIPSASDPSGWTQLTLGNSASTFPNASAPSNLASAGTLPLFTGSGSEVSLNSFVTANPDSGNPDPGYYQVREITSGTGANGTVENAADVLIDTTNNTWTLAYPTVERRGYVGQPGSNPAQPAGRWDERDPHRHGHRCRRIVAAGRHGAVQAEWHRPGQPRHGREQRTGDSVVDRLGTGERLADCGVHPGYRYQLLGFHQCPGVLQRDGSGGDHHHADLGPGKLGDHRVVGDLHRHRLGCGQQRSDRHRHV